MYPADIRVIIAQDSTPRHQLPQVLFDSKHLRQEAPGNSVDLHENGDIDIRRLYARGKSAHVSAENHAFDRSKVTSPTSSLAHHPTPTPRSSRSRVESFPGVFGQARHVPSDSSLGDPETAWATATREEKEDIDTMLGCMFGAAGLRLEAGTKLHIIPRKVSKPKDPDNKAHPTLRPVSSSGTSRFKTPLLRSSSAVEMDSSRQSGRQSASSAPLTIPPAIMFTRLFTVKIEATAILGLEEDAPSKDSMAASTIGTEILQPHTKTSGKARAKQKKVPMYAVAIILQLPDDNGNSSAYTKRFLGGRMSWKTLSPDLPSVGLGHGRSIRNFPQSDSKTGAIFDPQMMTHVSYVLTHARVINRAMELLDVSASFELMKLLEAIPLPNLTASPPSRGASDKVKRPKQPMQQSVYVLPECLQHVSHINRQITRLSKEIVANLRTQRAVTGQERWGAWKEEARWVARWAGNRDQNFFFYSVLTAFLGNHTVWLRSLAPEWHRRRCLLQRRILHGDTHKLAERTVIVAVNKMAARRLLFLLSAFFPRSCRDLLTGSSSWSERNTTGSASASAKASPRILKQSMHGRGLGLGLGMSGGSTSNHNRSKSFSVVEHEKGFQNHDRRLRGRRDSDVISLKTPTLAVPSRSRELRTSITSPTLTQLDSPVPHFTNLSSSVATNERRPGGRSSPALISLSHNLKRAGSISVEGNIPNLSRGSMNTRLTGPRRGGSNEADEDLASQRSSPVRGFFNSSPSKQPRSKLAQMIDEVESREDLQDPLKEEPDLTTVHKASPPSNLIGQSSVPEADLQTRQHSASPKTDKSSLKISYNSEDGFIDVSLPSSQSWESSLTSSFASLATSTLGMSHRGDHLFESFHCSEESTQQHLDPPVEVAGWLKTYQPSFDLQAVRPYDALLDEIKSSMHADAHLSPTSDLGLDFANGNWVDVCTTLVANTTTFTVKRLRLQKRKKTSSASQGKDHTGAAGLAQSPRTESFSPSAAEIESRLVSEPLMDHDTILVDAVERLLLRSGGSSRTHSRAPSPRPPPPPPRQGLHRSTTNESARSQRLQVLAQEGSASPSNLSGLRAKPVDVPFADCGKIVTGALHEVVRSVMDERIEDEGGAVGLGVDVEGEPGGSGGGGIAERSGGGGRGRREVDSTLREGIRRWLKNVEERTVEVGASATARARRGAS